MLIKIKRYSLFIISTFVLIFLLFTSCINKEVKNGSIDVLTLKGPSAMSMLFMMDKMNDLDGFPLSFEILDEPIQIRARMLKEEPEFTLLPTNLAANLYNKGVAYQVAAISVWGTLIVCGIDSSINDWQDLKGKRIHLMAKGMTPDILFRFLAEQNGLNPDEDLILDYSFPSHTDLANAVIAGLSDIAVLSEPMVSMVKAKNRDINVIFDLDEEWKMIFDNKFSIPQTSLLVKSSFASKNPELVLSFIEKYKEYCSKIDEDLQKASELAVYYSILPDAKVAKVSIPGCNLDVQPSWLVKDKVKAYLEVFYNFNPESIGGKMPNEAFFFQK